MKRLISSSRFTCVGRRRSRGGILRHGEVAPLPLHRGHARRPRRLGRVRGFGLKRESAMMNTELIRLNNAIATARNAFECGDNWDTRSEPKVPLFRDSGVGCEAGKEASLEPANVQLGSFPFSLWAISASFSVYLGPKERPDSVKKQLPTASDYRLFRYFFVFQPF